jgi:PAS domain S-box-containing protein
MSKFSQQIRNYGAAIGFVLVALLLMLILNPYVHLTQASFLLFFGAVVLSARYGGRSAGIVATLLSAFCANYFFLEPLNSFGITFATGSRMVLFILEGLLISVLVGSLRIAQQRTRESLNQLKASEAKFRRLADANIVGIVSADIYGSITDANDAFLNSMGYTREDLLAGRIRWDEMTPADLKPLDDQAYEELIATGKHSPYEKAFVSKQGQRIPILVAAALLEDDPEQVISLILDLSDRYHAEREIRRAHERFQFATAAVNSLIYDWDIQQNRVERTEGLTRIFGYSLDEAEPTSEWWNERIHSDDRQRVLTLSETLRRKKDRYAIEYRVCNQDNQYIHVLDQAIVVQRDAVGNPIRQVGSITDITERKQVEQALRESEARFRYIFEAAGVSIWEQDFSQVKAELDALKAQGIDDFHQYFADYPDFVHQAVSLVKVVDVNETTVQLFGASDKQELLNSLHRIFVPETLNVFVEELLAITAGDTFFEAETVLQTLKGERLNILLTITFPPSTAPFDRVLVSLVNITDRKRTEEALRQSERRFRRLVEADIFGVAFGDYYGNLFGANDAFLKIIGRDREELLAGQIRWDEITPPEFLHLDAQSHAELKQKGVCKPFEKEYVLKDGSRVPVLVASALLQEPYDQDQEVIGFILDLTEQKQAEAALRQSEERYRYLAESIPQLVWTADAEGTLLDVNERWLEFTGITLEQVQANGWADVVHPDDVPTLSQQWAAAQHNGTYYQAEGRMRRADGGYRWHLHQAVPVKNEHGQVTKWFGTATDIEEQKQLEQERDRILQQEQAARETAEAANRIKDEFLAVLSHELRTPLNPILGWAKLLQTSKFDQQTVQRALQTIERNAKLQTQLIDDLLDVSRILRGKLSLTICPVDLATVIEAAIDTVRLAAEAKNIQIHTTLNPRIGSVTGDAGRLQQVVWNLLSNAVKFTPSEGQIEVHLEQEGAFAQIQVKDTGQGIRPDFLPYVFDYFRQEDSKITRKFGGLGLGLAIVRHIVEAHGGIIQAESPGEGQGATFTVQIPLVKGDSSRQDETDSELAAANPHPLQGVQILVVDDDDDSLYFVSFILEQWGAEVLSATSASAALQILEQTQPDILVSDVGMPEVNGYVFLQQVRTTPKGENIPAIALTAYAGEINQQQALASGFQQHLAKPVVPETLMSTILSLLK